jgi:hypothetical protein
VTSHLSMWMVITMVSVWGNEARFTSWDEKVMGMWDHLVLGNGAFDSDAINLLVIIMMSSLGVVVGIGTSGNCEDRMKNIAGGVSLLRRFLDFGWRWRRWVGFGFDLRVGVIWHWVCDL